MGSSAENVDLFSFYTTKITRWKGNYPRIFSVGTHGLATYNPSSDSELTNYWQWTEVYNLAPLSTPEHPHQFQLVHRKGKSNATDAMRFESEHRALILTFALQQRGLFAKSHQSDQIHSATVEFKNPLKFRWGLEAPTQFKSLMVTCCGVEQINGEGEKKAYHFKDIENLVELSSEQHIFALEIKETRRLHIYSHPERSKIVAKIRENAATFIGVAIGARAMEEAKASEGLGNGNSGGAGLSTLLEQRLGIYKDDEHITSLCEFTVQNAKRTRVLLCLTETCLIERDPASYCITSLHPLSTIFALIRTQEDPQCLQIELTTSSTSAPRTYFSTERDSLLSSLIDGARASGNTGVHIKSKPTPQGKRWGPLCSGVDERVESIFLKFVHQPPAQWSWSELLIRFNANVAYSGLIHAVSQEKFFAENKEKLILVALNDLIAKENLHQDDYEEYFQLIRRIVCSKTGFGAFADMQTFREKLGATVVTALRSPSTSPCVIYSALDVISALMQPMHSDSDLRQEQDNKEKILNSPKFLESLLDLWSSHVRKGTGALVTMAMLDILTFALCAPYSETTLGHHFDVLLQSVASRAQVLFTLFQHPSVAIVKGAGLVMKALIEEGQGEIGRQMQEMALKEGALIRHLRNAMFLQGTTDARLLTLRQLSRHLVSLWTAENTESMELLRRILPPGLLRFLESEEKVQRGVTDVDRINTRDNLKIANEIHKSGQPKSEFGRGVRNVERYVEKQIEVALRHWRLKSAQEARRNSQIRPVTLRKRRQNLKITGNWLLLYHKFNLDHLLPDLIWNYPTREELREALQNEIRLLDSDRDHVTEICWNWQDFQVSYKSLENEIEIGGYYLRILLEDSSELGGRVVRDPRDFFNQLYHRFLLTGRPDMRALCLQAMTSVYGAHWREIGGFPDLKYVLVMLEKCTEKSERDRLLLFIQKLVLDHTNAREVVNCGGLRILVDLVTLAHLHTSRATVPTQSNVIEAGEGMKHSDSPEWYFMGHAAGGKEGGGKMEKVGPVGFQELKKLYGEGKLEAKSKCWAAGLDTWKHLQAIPQLKWFIIYEKQVGVMNESRMATVILDILIQIVSFCPARQGNSIIRPVHKAKQILSDQTGYLAHLVHLLLTFDPAIVERVASLLVLILEENPLISRIYSTGVFFMILMYTGSNILPISRFLHLTHMRQSTYTSQMTNSNSVWTKSVLGSLLPEAMVAYLENHGIERFSEIYLGEFDTPEAIWSAEMRRHLIEKIALHLSEFSPRLLSNTRALYEYCAIPAVNYPQVEHELFCSVFYLRNLTDEARFPDWPISDPIALLREVLEAWREEVDKRPPPMTVTDALRSLELDSSAGGDSDLVKKAYRRLAARFHPDKNPEGRERFEEANKAYEFLCSRHAAESGAPDPNRIVLILRAQTIIFKRYGYVLEPYKYSGYPMLIKTIQLEVDDESLFSTTKAPLLATSTELCFHTLNCSALNVEELRREYGLDLLLRAFDRCVSVLSAGSKGDEPGPSVCLHVTRCFGVGSGFQLCRDKMIEMQPLSRNLSRILSFRHLTKLNSAVAQCVTAMAVDTILQMQLLQAGVLWHLLTALFHYDFTLEEAGVAAAEETNSQILVNNHAKLCVEALRALQGTAPTTTASKEKEAAQRVNSEHPVVTPKNDVIRASLDALLLPYGAKLIREREPSEVLKILNENSRNPYLIWDNRTRAELAEVCERELNALRQGDGADGDPAYGAMHVYDLHKLELVIGGVFVRVYNEDPSFPLEEAQTFVGALLAYLSVNDPEAVGPNPSEEETAAVAEAITALANAIKFSSPGLETLCKGKFRLFSRYLVRPVYAAPMLRLLQTLVTSADCVKDIVGMGVVVGLLLVCAVARPGDANLAPVALAVLGSLVAHPAICKEAVQKGAIVYLLDLFITETLEPATRSAAAEVLAKLSSDKLTGPRIKILLAKFIPTIFVDAMTESPAAALSLYDSTTENPELVWNEETRAAVAFSTRQMRQELFIAQRKDPAGFDWRLPSESWKIDYNSAPGDLQVGGIWLRLYVANPGWNLRKPREFLKDLLEFALRPGQTQGKSEADEENLDLVGSSLVHLLRAHPSLADHLPAMGHLPPLLQAIASNSNSNRRMGALVLRSVASNATCVDSLLQLECISPIVNAMKKSAGDLIPVICEALVELYSSSVIGNSELVRQALEAKLVQHLLELLKKGKSALAGESGMSNPQATKACIVKCLQKMAEDSTYGMQVDEILGKSDIWGQYKSQNHDLFLSDRPTSGYLTSGSGSVAGFLTQGAAAGTKSNIPTSPPPLIE